MRRESRNSSGPSNRRIRTTPVPTPCKHVGVGAGALQESVLPCEAERLVVEGVAEETRVVDLEDVDLGEVPVERRRVGNRVHAVERVGDVDEPALIADRGEGVGERHAARDLLLEEEPDHLALVVGLDLLARDDDEVAIAGELDRLERSAEHVVVGDRDAAEPDRLGVVDELLGRDRAVVRPVRVHVEVDRDPVAACERVDVLGRAEASLSRQPCVDGVELVGDGIEALALGILPRLTPSPRTLVDVVGEAVEGLGDVGDGIRGHDRRAACRRLEREALLASRRCDEDRRRRRGRRCVAVGCALRGRARGRGPIAGSRA